MIIKTKIIIVIALALIVTIGTTTVFFIKLQNDRMFENKIKDTEFIGDMIERATESAMQDGNTEEVQNILDNIGKNKEITGLRIVNPSGTILKSTDHSEIGNVSTEFMKSAFTGLPQKPRVVNDTTINYFRPIMNREGCYACHSNKSPVIGVIQVKHDISREFTAFTSAKKLMIFSNLATVLVVSTVISILLSLLVINPLKKLLAVIRDVEAGDWQASVKINSNDELGVIGNAFNHMIGEVNKLYKRDVGKEREISKIKMDLEHKGRLEDLNSQLEFKIKEIETANRAVTALSKEVRNKNIELEKAVDRLKKINEIGQMLSSIIETRELMKIIIQTSADLLEAEKATIHLRRNDVPTETIRYTRGKGTERLNDYPFDGNGNFAEIFSHGRHVFISNRQEVSEVGPESLVSAVGVPLRMKGQVVGVMVLENNPDSGAFSKEEIDLLTTFSNQAMVAVENAWLYENLKKNYFSTIQSLVNALEASDRFTKGHSERVKMLSLSLGGYIGLDFRELELLEHAAILHDIGKIGIDNFILQKQGRLTAKEYSIIKTHPLIGDEILGPIETFDGVRKTIIQHHERHDGNGYPYGLRGDEISLKAKILSVVDTFDAMMTDRPYRRARSFVEVKEELKNHSGTQFDPYVVTAFVDMLNATGDDILSAAGYNVMYH